MNIPIRMYATSWCPDCRRAREFLRDHNLPFEEIDIEAHPEAAEFVKSVNSGKRKVPTFDFGGRVFHCSPYDARKLAREFGLSQPEEKCETKPSWLSRAISRSKKSTPS